MGVDVEKLWLKVRDYPNVIGYSPKIVYVIKGGHERHAWAFRVYVSKKVPVDELKPEDRLPDTLNGVPVDIVEFRRHFKGEVEFSKSLGYFDRYYSTVSYLLLGMILQFMSFMLYAAMVVNGGHEPLYPIPVATLILGAALICKGFAHLTSKQL